MILIKLLSIIFKKTYKKFVLISNMFLLVRIIMNKTNKFQIHNVKSIELDTIQFDKLYKTANGIIKAIVKYNGKQFLIRTPVLTLGSDIIKSGEDYYIDLIIEDNEPQVRDKNRKNKRSNGLLELIKNIDYLAISEIYENGQLWYEQNTDPNLIQIEKDYIPTIKLSTLNDSIQSLKLKVNSANIEFYDSDNVAVPYQLLKKGYTSTALLRLSQIYKENNHFWADWEILQLKTDIPHHIFTGCQLTDVNISSEEEEEAIYEDDNFY